MSRPGITQTIITDRYVVAAHAVANKARDDFSPKQIIAARHMANDGASVEEIRVAMGWSCTWTTARKRLSKFSIKPFGSGHAGGKSRAHRGQPTAVNGGNVSFACYRPKRVAE